MNLRNKKKLASRVLKVGVKRIFIDSDLKDEIKEAITRQDIKDLKKSGAIKIKQIKGRRKIEKRKTKRKAGSIRKKVNKRKQEYVKITRKLRKYIQNMKTKKRITLEDYRIFRKKIKSRTFKDLAHLRNALKEISVSDSQEKSSNLKGAIKK
ncbi:MAG: 50S ribosomal protein L19e [Nanoarchaeota archaeon]|nr:hypothetical protein [Nanoarchaeota archaeon]